MPGFGQAWHILWRQYTALGSETAASGRKEKVGMENWKNELTPIFPIFQFSWESRRRLKSRRTSTIEERRDDAEKNSRCGQKNP
jgi:hypothetical protein